jgi:phage-related protein
MREVAVEGLVAARYLRGEVREVRTEGAAQSFCVLFATEGRRGQVLLALQGFSKKTQRTPPEEIALAEQRLADWRGRARRTASR